MIEPRCLKYDAVMRVEQIPADYAVFISSVLDYSYIVQKRSVGRSVGDFRSRDRIVRSGGENNRLMIMITTTAAAAATMMIMRVIESS